MNKSQNSVQTLSLLCVLALLAVGVLFRTLGLGLDFWGDEAWWAARLNTEPLTNFIFRPIGYMWLSQQVGALAGNDLWFRLPSYLASIGTLLCIYFASRQLYRHQLTIFAVLFIAVLHPKLIVFAKEFKPYATEIFIHSVLITWALRCYKNAKLSKPFVLSCIASIPFCYNIVYLLPGVIWCIAGGKRQNGVKPMAWIRASVTRYVIVMLVLVFAALIILVVASPMFEGVNSRRLFWGAKYDTFPINLKLIQLIHWYVIKTVSLLVEPSLLRGQLVPVNIAFSVAFAVLAALGLVLMIRRQQHQLLALLAGSLVCLLLANLLWVWPYGSFRANLFLIPSVLLIFGIGLDHLLQKAKHLAIIKAGLLLLMINFLPFDLTPIKYKMAADGAPSPQITKALAIIEQRYQQQPLARNIIVTDWHSWRPIDYYLFKANGVAAFPTLTQQVRLIRGPLNNRNQLLNIVNELKADAVASGEPARVWVVVTKLKRFGGMEHTRLFKQYLQYKAQVGLHDPEYHPIIFELGF